MQTADESCRGSDHGDDGVVSNKRENTHEQYPAEYQAVPQQNGLFQDALAQSDHARDDRADKRDEEQPAHEHCKNIENHLKAFLYQEVSLNFFLFFRARDTASSYFALDRMK